MDIDVMRFEGTIVPISIQAFTLGLDGKEHPTDINPGEGDVIHLQLDLANCAIIDSDPSISGNCDQRRTPEGDGDQAPEKQPSMIWFHITRKP
jgi:hypothetical protein